MKTQRTCLALDLKDDDELIAQYEHFHQPEHIWPEIPQGIRAVGVVDMQIYRLGRRLFMIVETQEGIGLNTTFETIGKMPLQAEWATLMNGLQQRLTEGKPHDHWAEMYPIFLINEGLK